MADRVLGRLAVVLALLLALVYVMQGVMVMGAAVGYARGVMDAPLIVRHEEGEAAEDE